MEFLGHTIIFPLVVILVKLFKLLLLKLLVVEIKLSELLKELSEVVLRVSKLSFLTGMINNIGDTNRDTFGLNSMRFSSKGFSRG